MNASLDTQSVDWYFTKFDCCGQHGAVAQLGERLNGIQEVEGSIPFRSTFRQDMARLRTTEGTVDVPSQERHGIARTLKADVPQLTVAMFRRRNNGVRDCAAYRSLAWRSKKLCIESACGLV